MNINPAAAYGAYKAMERQTTPHATPRQTAGFSAPRSENTDQIQISSEGSRQLEIERVSQSILSELKAPAQPERLESLKTAVQNKSYHVPTQNLVDAMMGHWFGR